MNHYYYFTKENPKNWSGDDNGALEQAQALALKNLGESSPLDKKFLEKLEKYRKIKGTIIAKGKNLDVLLAQIEEKQKQFDLDRLTFLISGNQTETTQKFISNLRQLGGNCKIHATVLPNTLTKETEVYADDKIRVEVGFDAITGTTPKNVHKKLFQNDQSRALLSLEQKFGKRKGKSFVMVHWGGPEGKQGISDEEQNLHKTALIKELQTVGDEHGLFKILFVPHGRRSFIPDKNSHDTKENREQDMIKSLQEEFGTNNILTGINYAVALEFTRAHQKDCSAILTTAENLSTLAEQLSILSQNHVKKPPLHILLLPCCGVNNDIWQAPLQITGDWLCKAGSIWTHEAKTSQRSRLDTEHQFTGMTVPNNIENAHSCFSHKSKRQTRVKNTTTGRLQM